MSASPWIKWFSGDFLNGISDLEPNEIAVYSVVLNLIYDNEGPIKDDAVKIGRRCNMRQTSAEKALASLATAGKIKRSAGEISNSRCEKEIESRRKVGEKSAENANVRWKKPAEKTSKNNKDAMPPHQIGIATDDAIQKPEPEKKKEDALHPTREKRASPAEDFSIWWDLFPNKVGKDVALKAFLKARKTAPLADLIDGLKRYIATKPAWKEWCNPATWLNQGRWKDEPAVTLPFVSRADPRGSAPDQAIAGTRRALARINPGRWAPSEGNAPHNGNAGMDDFGGGSVVIDHEGQAAGNRGDDGGISSRFLSSAGLVGRNH